MIRVLSLFIFLFIAGQTIAQTAKKYIFTERFTNTVCVPCATENIIFEDIVENHVGDMHHLTVHAGIPSSSCQFYADNVNDNFARQDFLRVNETPAVFMNGTETMGTAIITDQAIKDNLNQRTSLGVEVDAEITGIEMRGFVNVHTTGDVPVGDLRIMIAAVETSIDYFAPNGETKHRNVLRELARTNGVPFTPDVTGGFRTFPFDFKSDFNWNIDQMYILAWVEDAETKEVLNSGSQFDPPINFEPSSVSDLQAVSFTMSPNPASDILNLKFEKPVFAQIRILNLEGKEISSTKINSTHSKSLDISNLAKGIYLLKIETEQGNSVRRFVKQ